MVVVSIELSTDLGIDCYDFEARLQYPSQLRFNRPDPMAIKTPGLNTYLYCSANPIMLVDPTGCVVDSIWPNIGPVIPPTLFVGWKVNPFYTNL
ncbi:MAG: hypothetical protein K2I64_00585 [Muribaculaceae bacterium]|nr:hypothetical protein [Muribaculaceae bacterium]